MTEETPRIAKPTDDCPCIVWDVKSLDEIAVRYCAEHHRYWRDSKELVSVTKVLRHTWPIKPDRDTQADPRVIENARHRGVIVDGLFSAYVIGQLDPESISDDIRQDAVELFKKLRRWWDSIPHGNPRSQVILADQDVAGMCDVRDGRVIYDLKCTYDVDPTYPLQLAGYAQLANDSGDGPTVDEIAILHLAKRFKDVRVITIDFAQAMSDWRTLRAMYEVVQRRMGRPR